MELVLGVNPQVPDLAYPFWAWDRRAGDDRVWLTPDTGFVIEQAGKATGRPDANKAGAAPMPGRVKERR